jgi:PKD repeat protein
VRFAVIFALASLLLPATALAADHVIAIDVSGSMRWNEAGQRIGPGQPGPMRIEIVRPPLVRFLGNLPDDSRVFLMAFNNGIVADGEFVLKRDGERARMLAWVEALNPPRNSRTHLWSTLRKALQKARAYASAAPGEWVSVRVITDGEDDHPGSNLTLTRVLDEFPEIAQGRLRPDLVLLGSLKLDFVTQLEKEQEAERVNVIRPQSMADPFPPIIGALPDPVVAGGRTRVFDDSESEFSRYRWYVNGTPVSEAADFEHTFDQPGLVEVRVEVVRPDGSRDAANRTLTIRPKPVSAAFYAPADIVAAVPVVFVSRARGDGTRYAWTVNDSPVGTSEDLEHAFAEAGSHRVRLVVVDALGNTDEEEQTVVVGEPKPAPAKPVAVFRVIGEELETGAPIQFMDDSTGLIESYSWDFGGAGRSAEKNPVFSFPDPGQRAISLEVAGPGGTARTEKVIEIKPAFVAPGATIAVEPGSGRVPFAVQFTVSANGDYDTIEWDFGDGATSTELQALHEYTAPGEYRPALTLRHMASGLEGRFEVTEPVVAKAPLPVWFWPAALAAFLVVLAAAGAGWWIKTHPPLTGRLEWSRAGQSGSVVIAGRRFSLASVEVPDWESGAKYHLRGRAGRVFVCDEGGAEVELPLHEPVPVDDAVLTYRGFD